MVKPIRNEPNIHASPNGQTTGKRSTTSYQNTTNKVKAAAGNVDFSTPSTANMKKREVTPQQPGGENLASFVNGKKRPGKELALTTEKVAIPAIPNLNVEKKVPSAGLKLSVVNSDKNVTTAANTVLGKGKRS